jgi:Ser/Thr protein kinase RdoA (MazF antagonist)
MRRLEETLTGCGSHRLGAEIRPLGEAVLEAWERWTSRFSGSEGASRPSHGDLKVSNIRFREACPEATCLIDLDTLGSLPLSVEMGDALRSWCNPADEDEPPRLDEEILASALRGYLHASPVLSAEVRATLIPGLWRVCLELAARFCADAFHERYFGWDPAVASGRGEHNLLRAGGQFALAGLVEARLDVLELLATRDAGPNRDRA